MWPWSRIAELRDALTHEKLDHQTTKWILREAEAAVARTTEARRALEGQLVALTNAIVDLKRDGFNPPAMSATALQDDLVPVELVSAVRDLGAKPGSTEWTNLIAEGEALIANGSDAKDAAIALRRGGKFRAFD